jgi:glycosyltransferase involved in cell wall biosynthesis
MAPTLSLTLIVRDEEVHIPQVLGTAHLFADEIVVVDTGSTDRTRDLARQYTSQVLDFPWCDDFAAARNFGIARCTKDFVMWLDADDVIPAADAQRIRPLLAGEPNWDVAMLPYHYVHDEQGRTTLLTRRERIFRNGRGILFQYPVHECLRYPEGTVVINNTDIAVHHRNLRRREPSNVRNLRILSKAVEQAAYRNDFRMWWLLAQEEAPEKAILYYRKLLAEFGHDLAPTLHSEVCVQFARKLMLADRFDEALQILGQAMVLFPLWREPFFIAGQILWQRKRYPEALHLILIAGTIPPPGLGIGNLDARIYDGDEYFEWLFVAYYAANDREGVRRTIERALKRNPANPRFLERQRELLAATARPA